MALIPLAATVILSSIFSWAIYSGVCLLRNYRSARKLGLPIRVLPISHGNPFWMIVDSKVTSLFRRLPFGDNNFTRYNWRGWEVRDRCRSHLEMGDAYVQVTPGRNWVYLCSPESLLEVFRRRSDFPRPLELYELLNIFGSNLSTVDGPQWKKQRKITASCFNESTSEAVWTESLSLATDMLKFWSSKEAVSSTADDVRTLSLHVLSKAGFGKSFKFQSQDDHASFKDVNPALDYKESLKTVLDNCVLIMALGTKFLARPWLPNKLRNVHKACVAFQRHMTGVYEEEKRAFAQGLSTDRNLLSSLIRASNEEANKTSSANAGSSSVGGLTENEIYGNMFVFNFAGHDTTAHTLMFAIAFLAANPEVQTWLSEELSTVFADRATPDQWDYQQDFPKLTRCHAVLMETVHLYTPVPVAKWTEISAQTLQVGDKHVTIPSDTMVIPSYTALHTHPRFWGQDALQWRPDRWVTQGADGREELKTPARGTFIAWSEGERSCPGKRFSQVEFVATMAVLFKDWRVSPQRFEGEQDSDARQRLSHLIETDSAQVLLLQMLHPERAPLCWSKAS
ncbi:cytochrome P450 [Hypoxylon sp. NC1633]|nr:cytochrome P450 [Hypoxylon sp. NC1633]